MFRLNHRSIKVTLFLKYISESFKISLTYHQIAFFIFLPLSPVKSLNFTQLGIYKLCIFANIQEFIYFRQLSFHTLSPLPFRILKYGFVFFFQKNVFVSLSFFVSSKMDCCCQNGQIQDLSAHDVANRTWAITNYISCPYS